MHSAIKISNGKYYVSIDVASQIIGVTSQTLVRWRNMPNPPPYDVKLGYELIALGEWIRTEQIYKQGKGGGTNFPWKPDFTRFPDYQAAPVTMPGVPLKVEESEKARLERLKGDKLEIEINTLAGTLVSADDVEIAVSGMVSRVKTRLLAIPSTLAPRLVGKDDRFDIQELLEYDMTVELEELSSNYRQNDEEDTSD